MGRRESGKLSVKKVRIFVERMMDGKFKVLHQNLLKRPQTCHDLVDFLAYEVIRETR